MFSEVFQTSNKLGNGLIVLRSFARSAQLRYPMQKTPGNPQDISLHAVRSQDYFGKLFLPTTDISGYLGMRDSITLENLENLGNCVGKASSSIKTCQIYGTSPGNPQTL